MKPKVALVNPGQNIYMGTNEPLNLCSLAAYLLQHDIETIIIDELAGQNFLEKVKEFQPTLIGVTATTTVANDAYRIGKLCKEMGIKSVIGGVHVTIMPEEGAQHFDHVVVGEGEIALLELAQGKINDDEKIIKRDFIKDINTLPLPARHLLDMDLYSRAIERYPFVARMFFAGMNKRSTILVSGRGCPYNCNFCHNHWRNTPVRYNTPERVIEEIEYLMKNFGITIFQIIEDNIMVNKKRFREICNLIIEKNLNIKWFLNSRVDNVDLELFKLAKKAGCRQVCFGVESGSQKILDILNKRTTEEQIINALEVTKQAGLLTFGNFMIGNPDETMEDIKKSQAVINHKNMDYVGIGITTPLPGTKLWEMCKDEHPEIVDIPWDEYDFDFFPIVLSKHFTPESIRKIRFKLYSKALIRKPRWLWELSIRILRYPIKFTKKILDAFNS